MRQYNTDSIKFGLYRQSSRTFLGDICSETAILKKSGIFSDFLIVIRSIFDTITNVMRRNTKKHKLYENPIGATLVLRLSLLGFLFEKEN